MSNKSMLQRQQKWNEDVERASGFISAHTHTNTHSFSLSLSLSLSKIHILIYAHTHSRKLRYTYSHKTHTHYLSLSLKYTHTHTTRFTHTISVCANNIGQFHIDEIKRNTIHPFICFLPRSLCKTYAKKPAFAKNVELLCAKVFN